MSRPTFSHLSDWADDVPASVGHSQRATTSSRHPGTVYRGTVAYALTRIVECLDCGHLRYALGGPHAPRWRDGRLVDCVGRDVSPDRTYPGDEP